MKVFAILLFGVGLFVSAAPAYADDVGRIAVCTATTPVRIFARLFGARPSLYCSPWLKEQELARAKTAKTPPVADASQGEEAPQPAVLTAKASK